MVSLIPGDPESNPVDFAIRHVLSPPHDSSAIAHFEGHPAVCTYV